MRIRPLLFAGRLFLILGASSHLALAAPAAETPATADQRMSAWMTKQLHFGVDAVLDNMVGAREILDGRKDPRGLPGAIIAAPSVAQDTHEEQDYRWSWKRDGALAMRFLVRMMMDGPLAHLPEEKKLALEKAYVDFAEREQKNHYTVEGGYELGHAKSTLLANRNPYKWGYPQNDGPPLQNLTLDEILRRREGAKIGDAATREQILRIFNRNTLYILNNFDKPAVEAWEEVKADSHFSILIENHKALLLARDRWIQQDQAMNEARRLQKRLPKPLLTYTFRQIEVAIEQIKKTVIEKHLSKEKGHILSHVGQIIDESWVREKSAQLDMQVIMSSLRINKFWEIKNAPPEKLFMAPSSPWMRITFERLRARFATKYPVNIYGTDPATGRPLPGTAFGRYPEDIKHFNGAPWFITSFAAIQHLLWDAMYITHRKQIVITDIDRDYFWALDTKLKKEDLAGDENGLLILPDTDPRFAALRAGLIKFAKDIYFRLMVHAGESLHMTELFNGASGMMEGIQDLSWTYVESVKAIRMFERARVEFGLDIGDLRVGGGLPSLINAPAPVLSAAASAVCTEIFRKD